jgi:hypothetical protein
LPAPPPLLPLVLVVALQIMMMMLTLPALRLAQLVVVPRLVVVEDD